MSRRALLALALLVAASGGCSRDGGRSLPLPSPSPPRWTPGTAGFSDAGLGSRIAVLDAPGGSDEAKVAVIEGLAADHGDAVTGVLLRFVDVPSTLVAAASIKALSGRGCERVERALVRLLESDDWQRRAWAAKVLGTNGCVGAAPALAERARREDDARVGDHVHEAMRRLGAAHVDEANR